MEDGTMTVLSKHKLVQKEKISILAFIAAFALLAPASTANAAEWRVVDAGWCDLVYMPFPNNQAPQNQQTPILGPIASRPKPRIQESITIEVNNVQTTVEEIVPSKPSVDDESDFESLFNGENLDGWIVQGLEKAGPKIEEGGILKISGWDYWAVITKEDFTNFILRFDVMFEKKGNSGILIHTPKKEVYKSSFEIQMADDEGKNEPKKWPGAIFGHVAPTKNAFNPIGEWNAVEIKFDAPQIWVTVNGEVVQDGVDVNQIEGLKHKFEKGGIALQRNDYKKAAFYKNIRIKRLPD